MDGPSFGNEPECLQIREDDIESLLSSLLYRAEDLLQQFKEFQSFLQQNQKSHDFEARIFRRGVESEVKSLRALTQNNVSAELTDLEAEEHQSKRLHVLRSSNLPFYEAIWTTANSSRGVRALGRRVYWNELNVRKRTSHVGKAAAKSAMVDLVSNDGLAWTKVSIVTEKRLLFDMAKEGWEAYGPDSENSEGEDETSSLSHKASKLELVRLAEDLRDAARSVRMDYKHPVIFFVLPRLTEGSQKEVDAMLADIRATGAIVQCGQPPGKHYHDVAAQFQFMSPTSHLPTLTSTLNIDCTILLALISDISHLPRHKLPPSPTSRSGQYHTAIIKQIESEEKSPLLPNELYPALSSRTLVCTDLAAQRMREIVNTMGTASERTRADILVGEGTYASLNNTELRAALQTLSSHSLPETVQLPVTVISYTSYSSSISTPTPITSSFPSPSLTFPCPIADKLTTTLNLSPINTSVFLYGWQHNIVTITSNRVVATQIEKGLNEILDEQERDGKAAIRIATDTPAAAAAAGVEGGGGVAFEGPKIWVCESARSLVGKDKVGGLRP